MTPCAPPGFVPPGFVPPARYEHQRFLLRMLTIHDAEKDYEAVMSSRKYLHECFGEENGWPEGLTLEQNMIDLGWHQKEFQLRRSFAYTVMTPDDTRCLGCVYVDPSDHPDEDARVTLWVRVSEHGGDLDALLFRAVRKWLSEKWPFKHIAFPGRETDEK